MPIWADLVLAIGLALIAEVTLDWIKTRVLLSVLQPRLDELERDVAISLERVEAARARIRRSVR